MTACSILLSCHLISLLWTFLHDKWETLHNLERKPCCDKGEGNTAYCFLPLCSIIWWCSKNQHVLSQVISQPWCPDHFWDRPFFLLLHTQCCQEMYVSALSVNRCWTVHLLPSVRFTFHLQPIQMICLHDWRAEAIQNWQVAGFPSEGAALTSESDSSPSNRELEM